VDRLHTAGGLDCTGNASRKCRGRLRALDGFDVLPLVRVEPSRQTVAVKVLTLMIG
jgi:hypothetical protein